jgi:hypothetical protein
MRLIMNGKKTLGAPTAMLPTQEVSLGFMWLPSHDLPAAKAAALRTSSLSFLKNVRIRSKISDEAERSLRDN